MAALLAAGCSLLSVDSGDLAGAREQELNGNGAWGVNDDWGIAAPGYSGAESYRLAREAGLTWVRYVIYWYNVQDASGAIRWDDVDRAIGSATANGLSVYATISWPSSYSTPSQPHAYRPWHCMSVAVNPPIYDPNLDPLNCQPGVTPDVEKFKAFVRAAVARYGDRVKHWGFANEYRNPVFWRGGSVYDFVLIPGYDAAHAEAAAHGWKIQVVGPDTDVPSDLDDALRAERSVYGRRMFDVLSVHAYAHGVDSFAAVYRPYRDFGGRRPVWVTEGGAESGGDPASLARQADALAALHGRMSAAISAGTIDKFFIYRLRGGAEEWQTREEGAPRGSVDYSILFGTGRPKPAYYELKRALCPNDDCGSFSFDGAVLSRPGTWFFGEGATELGVGFETEYALYNDGATTAHVDAVFFDERGRATQAEVEVPAWSRRTVRLGAHRPSGGYAAAFSPRGGAKISAARTMYWRDRLAGHSSAGADRLSTSWHFAEGSTNAGYFEDFFTVFNPNTAALPVRARFLRRDGQVIEASYTAPPLGRLTISTSAPPVDGALSNTDFSTVLTAPSGFVAERSMYWNGFRSGTNTFGAAATANTWEFAEGYQASGWDTYLLVSNPGAAPLTASIDVFFDDGRESARRTLEVPASGRATLHAGTAGITGAFAARITAPSPVVAERAMYFGGWSDGHASLGAASLAMEWHLPDGDARTGHDSFVLISNPGSSVTQVVLTAIAENGLAIQRNFAIGPRKRQTLWVSQEGALAGQRFAATVKVTAGPGVVAEMARYWNGWSAGSGGLGIPR